MIEKAIAYKNSKKDLILNLKKLGLSDEEINLILKKYSRKKFDDGGDGGGGGGDGGGDGGDGGDSGDSGDSSDSSVGDTMGSSTAQDAAANQAASEAAQNAASDMAMMGMPTEEPVGIMSVPEIAAIINPVQTYLNQTVAPAITTAVDKGISLAKEAYANAIANPLSTLAGMVNPALGMVANAINAANRGVTGPSDDTQEQTSVQVSTPTSTNDGGISTIQSYAPLYNVSTGDNTADALRTRLYNLIQTQQPNTQQIAYGLPSIDPYANYTLLDLYNLRRR